VVPLSPISAPARVQCSTCSLLTPCFCLHHASSKDSCQPALPCLASTKGGAQSLPSRPVCAPPSPTSVAPHPNLPMQIIEAYQQLPPPAKLASPEDATPLQRTFGLEVREEVHCPACSKSTHHSSYEQFFYNTQVRAGGWQGQVGWGRSMAWHSTSAQHSTTWSCLWPAFTLLPFLCPNHTSTIPITGHGAASPLGDQHLQVFPEQAFFLTLDRPTTCLAGHWAALPAREQPWQQHGRPAA